MEEPVRGTVTSLSSIFPAEKAQKALEHVQEAISERQIELDQLQGFLNDNTNLINLVQKLPDELHHDIMVPFGKAAFFPGQLIHTNEFLVLLGEGYFADRTSKQTIEILKRRGKGLESQIEPLKAVMLDLRAEASFFNDTATEAAEGLLEIREDYIDEASTEDVSVAGMSNPDVPSFSKADSMKAAVEDAEYARLMSRIDELEKEELEAENANECEEDDEADLDKHLSQFSPQPEVKSSEVSSQQEQSKDEHLTREGSLEDHFKKDFSDQFDFEGSKVHLVSKDVSSHGKVPASSRSNITEKILELPQLKENVQVTPASKNEVSVPTSEPGSNSSKAFTGSIIEHTHNIKSNPSEQTSVPISKPVSRFKLQRR